MKPGYYWLKEAGFDWEPVKVLPRFFGGDGEIVLYPGTDQCDEVGRLGDAEWLELPPPPQQGA